MNTKMRKNKKAFQVGDIWPVAMVILVTAIAIGMGSQLLGGLGEEYCDGSLEHYELGVCFECPNSSYNTFNTTSHNCQISGTNTTFVHTGNAGGGDTAFNATAYGLESNNTFSSYLPTIALVIVAAIIIGILVTYLARRV